VDACAPIMVHGKHLGNWLIGQNHVGDVDEARVRQYAREIEVNKHEFLKAFEEMPKNDPGGVREKASLPMGIDLSHFQPRVPESEIL